MEPQEATGVATEHLQATGLLPMQGQALARLPQALSRLC